MKTPVLVKLAAGFEINRNISETDIAPLVDPNCPNIELAHECEDLCVEDLGKCITACGNDSSCTADCYRGEIDCIDSCPCHADCPQGQDSNVPFSCMKNAYTSWSTIRKPY